MTLPLILFLTSAVQGIILSAIFLLYGKHVKKKLLGVFLLSFAITILHYVFIWSPDMEAPVALKLIGAVSGWLIPPSLYLFFRYDGAFSKRDLFHLPVPLLSVVLWLLAFFRIWHAGRFYAYFNICFLLVYAFLILKKRGKNPVDSLLMYGYFVYCIGFVAYYIMLFTDNYTLEMDYIICAAFTVVIYGVVYYSQRDFLKEKIRSPYATSSLDEEEGKYLIEKIKKLIVLEGLYKDVSFNLTTLSDKLKVPKYRISQALNLYSEQSFSELINSYRVEDARKLLESDDTAHLKVEAIGEAVGYRNKVSFYKNFKNHTGLSPGQYRNQAVRTD